MELYALNNLICLDHLHIIVPVKSCCFHLGKNNRDQVTGIPKTIPYIFL